ncbi:MAG: hypothetical protein KHZ29_06355 [Desulfovibrionaceae bacterium]|nr:hypothetical protein [Desulfovibrionaceae bacterium]
MRKLVLELGIHWLNQFSQLLYVFMGKCVPPVAPEIDQKNIDAAPEQGEPQQRGMLKKRETAIGHIPAQPLLVLCQIPHEQGLGKTLRFNERRGSPRHPVYHVHFLRVCIGNGHEDAEVSSCAHDVDALHGHTFLQEIQQKAHGAFQAVHPVEYAAGESSSLKEITFHVLPPCCGSVFKSRANGLPVQDSKKVF